MTHFTRSIILGCSMLALAACGADDVVAPGGPIVIPTPGPTGGPTPPPTGDDSVTAAASCTPGTTDLGTIELNNGRGTVRNCRVPNLITGTLELSARRADGVMYSLNGRTDVGVDIELTGGTAGVLDVAPGVTVFAEEVEETTLVVNRGSRIEADGTAAQPIIFTARDNLDGTLTDSSDYLWGGIIINGRAPIADCDSTVSTSTTGGDAGCWRRAEGVTATTLFGGALEDDNSGTLRYVQVNFTGFGGGGDEIQGITTGGVGSGTTISYVQIHNSRDDGIESFGGTQNMDHLVFTGISDDSLDTDNGYNGAVQFMLAVRRANGTDGDDPEGETIFEVDSGTDPNNLPRQKLKVANFTVIQPTADEPVMRLRGGADVTMANGIVVARNGGNIGCVDVDNAETVQTSGDEESGPPVFHSVVFDCDRLAYEDDAFQDAALNNVANTLVNLSFTNTLQFLAGSTVGRVANGSNELIQAFTGLAELSTYFDPVDYIGAFSGPDDRWTEGWTCNSDVADLRGATACTDIRIS